MKISFFIGSMGRGGAERVISTLANDYCNRGWDVEIAVLLKNIVEYPLDARIRIVDISQKAGGYLQNAFYWVWGIRSYLKARKPDRVVSFVGRINALVLTASIGLKIPIVVSERNDPKHDGRGRLMQWYCNRIYHLAKAIVYQNEYEKSCFNESLSKRGYIIPNPVKVTAHKENYDTKTIVTAGRLIEQKNQAMLIRAMEKIHKKYPEVKCKIYGEGPLRRTLQQQIEALNLQNTVTLEGNVPDIHERLAQCGIFVLTSNFEGLSNALIEAMMVGLPCISTDYPGVRELIEDSANGLVVPLNNVDALVQNIERLIENKDDYFYTIANRGQAESSQFCAQNVLALWQNVIGE